MSPVDVTVCIVDEPEQLANLREFFFNMQATYTEVLYEDREDLGVAYRAGRCNAVSASASQGLRSGWNFIAHLRYARLMSSSDASRGTPSTS